jgi:hypothetical protein
MASLHPEPSIGGMWSPPFTDQKRWVKVVWLVLGVAILVGSILSSIFGWASQLSGQVVLAFVGGVLYAGILMWIFASGRRKLRGLSITEEDLEQLRHQAEEDDGLDGETSAILLRELASLRRQVRSRDTQL